LPESQNVLSKLGVRHGGIEPEPKDCVEARGGWKPLAKGGDSSSFDSMVAAVPLHFFPPPAPPVAVEVEDRDQRFFLNDIAWEAYVALNDVLGDRSGARVCYCEGTVELMSPSYAHEDVKTRIARLVELYAVVRDIPLHGLGSMTYRSKVKSRGAEPDECYFIGKVTKGPPHLAIEVGASRSAIDKLSLYAGLGVRELWLWENEGLSVHALGKVGYRQVKRSKLLPRLDIEELVSFVRIPDQAAAARAYLKRLGETGR
jgi:Uma2 family endonuclease